MVQISKRSEAWAFLGLVGTLQFTLARATFSDFAQTVAGISGTPSTSFGLGSNGLQQTLLAPSSSTARLLAVDDVLEISRLAELVDSARCPSRRHSRSRGFSSDDGEDPERFSSRRSRRRSPSTGSSSPRSKRAQGSSKSRHIIASSKFLPELPAPARNIETGDYLQFDEAGHPIYRKVSSNEKHYMLIESSKRTRNGKRIRQKFRLEEHDVADQEQDDIDWYISYDSSTAELTAVLTSFASTENFASLLYNPPHPRAETLLGTMPASLFPAPSFNRSEIKIHAGLAPYIERHATSIFRILSESARMPLTFPSESHPARLDDGRRGREDVALEGSERLKISKIRIVGHGLGGDLATLIALALDIELNDNEKNYRRDGATARVTMSQIEAPEIEVTTFGASRIGNSAFARYVDSALDPKKRAANSRKFESGPFEIRRVSAFGDPIPHLPPVNFGFSHFSAGDLRIDEDPVYVWRHLHTAADRLDEGKRRSETANLADMFLEDHLGPYGGVRIGSERC